MDINNKHKKKDKYQQQTEYEIWRNVIPKNNNLKETFKLHKSEIQNVIEINQYVQTKDDLLGAGFQGQVYKVQNQNDQKYQACKIFLRSTLDNTVTLNTKVVKIEEFISKELEAAKLLLNNNLTIATEIIDDAYADSIYLIMELCEGEFCRFDEKLLRFNNDQFLRTDSSLISCNLFAKKLIDYSKLKKTYRQLVNGLLYLHRLNLAHCDLKPQNIMIKDNNAKIADFGSLAWTDPTDHLKSTLDNGFGTPQFNAPESIHKHDRSSIDKFKCDIWALGMIFYIFAFGQLPFEIRMFNQSIVPNTLNIQWNVIDLDQYQSRELRQFIEQILVVNPSERPCIYEIIEHEQLLDENETQNLCNCSQNNQTPFDNSSPTKNQSYDFINWFFHIYGYKNVNDDSDQEQGQEDIDDFHQSNKSYGTEFDRNKSSTGRKKIEKKRSYAYKKSKTTNINSDSLLENASLINNQSFKSKYVQSQSNNNNQRNSLKNSDEDFKDKIKIIDKSNQRISKNIKDLSIYDKQSQEKKDSSFSSSFDLEENIPEVDQSTIDNKYNKNFVQSYKLAKISEKSESISINNNHFKTLSTSLYDSAIKSFTTSKKFYNKNNIFNVIYESVNHKQGFDENSKEKILDLRRQSDSLIFDVIELKNRFIIKDHVIQEFKKRIDQLEKHLK